MSLEMSCADWIVFAACTLKDEPGMMALCGAQEVTLQVALESSSDFSLWSRIVQLEQSFETLVYLEVVGTYASVIM